MSSSGHRPTNIPPNAASTIFEKIPTRLFSSSAQACSELAGEVAELIRGRQKEGKVVVLGLATGSTPVPFYRELIRRHKEEELSFHNVITFNLDEYYGLPKDHPESYARFMHDQLFAHIDIDPANTHLPDGMIAADRIFDSCQEYEEMIDAAGGIDLQILGIGRTGHIGFNEPGSTKDSLTRRITLDRITRQDAAMDFLGEANVPRFAITMGVGTIMRAKRVVLMAWGGNKADIVNKAVEGPGTDVIPASFLQGHTNASFFLDNAAAGALTRIKYPWLVGPVRWTDREARRGIIWLSRKMKKPVLKLVDEDYNEHSMGDLLTERGRAYSLNIAIFNELQHTITGWPGGKKDADDRHRPERALPFPKRVLIFAPEPQDAVTAIGGTIDRLVEQGHEVVVAIQTSANLRVHDNETRRFCKVLLELSARDEARWGKQGQYAEEILRLLEIKGDYGEDAPELRSLKSLILRGEVEAALKVCGVKTENIIFMDLPFYEKGRYRRFRLGNEDVECVSELFQKHLPHQIYATGEAGDPSSLSSLCFQAVERAWSNCQGQEWQEQCRVWNYRSKERPLDLHEIDMTVPLSPDQLQKKQLSFRKFQQLTDYERQACERDRIQAKNYDSLGLAEYEAVETLQRWNPES